MYKVYTETEIHQFITGWEEWKLDSSFIQFNREEKDNFTIIAKKHIKYITQK